MKTDEQFKDAVFARCALRRRARRQRAAGVFYSGLCLFLVSCAAFVLSLPDPQQKRPETVVPPPMPKVEVCSPDGGVVYCTFTKQEEVDALTACRPTAPAEESKGDTMKNDNSLAVPSFSVRYTDAEGNVQCILIGNYFADAQEGWETYSAETAAPLIEKLKELGCEIS